MKSQQEAEREEQRRIKNLVLNYDLNDNDGHDGTFDPAPIYQRPLDRSSYAKSISKPRPR
jgi:regulator of nonsense transcripts 2